MILNIEGSDKTPMQLLKLIDDQKLILFGEVAALDTTQSIGPTGREVIYNEQELTYNPKVTNITTYMTEFDVSLKYTGSVYGVILDSNAPRPNVQQIRQGFNSENKQTNSHHAASANLVVDTSRGYAIWPHGKLQFSFLFHFTEYTAYFSATRDTYGLPILMTDKNVKMVKIKTTRQIFQIEDSYEQISHCNIIRVVGIGIYIVLILFYVN